MSTRGRPHRTRLERCPCSGLTLAKLLRPAVTAVLAGGPAHGYVIVERLAAMPLLAGERPDPPGVYRALMAMESCGLVRSEWDLSERGPARRVYSLTPAGGECVFRWAETLRRYHASLGALIRLVERAASGKPCGTCCGKRGGR